MLKTTPPTGSLDSNVRQPTSSTTLSNVGGEVGTWGATAFVFTSSRTLRALQDTEEEDSRDQCPPDASISLVPCTPSPLSSTPPAQHTKTQRASLTLSQLDKHSEGAISARSLLDPSMRAAGFVNLPHSRLSQRSVGIAGALSKSPHSQRTLPSIFPTKPPSRNPPDFPPILFVKPSHVTTTSMWENQMKIGPSLAMTYPRRIALGSATSRSVRTSKSSPRPRVLSGASFFTSEPLPQRPLSPSSRYPGPEPSEPLSPPPSSTLLSTSAYPSFQVDKASEHGPRSCPSDSGSRSRNGKAREWSGEPGELPLPISRTSPRSNLSARSHGSRAFNTIKSVSPQIGGAIPPIAHSSYSSSAGAAPSLVPEAPPGSTAISSSGSFTAVSSSTSLSRPSNAQSPSTSSLQRRWRSSEEKLAKSKAKNRSSAGTTEKTTPCFSTARRLGHQRPCSFTELCDQSSFVWTSKYEMFAPPAPIARSCNVSAIAPSLSRSPAIAEAHKPPPLRPPRHPRRHAKAYEKSLSTSGRAHLIASAPLRNVPVTLSEPDSGLEMDSEKAKMRKPRKTMKGGDRASIDKGTKGASKFLNTVDTRGVSTRDGSTGSYGAFFVCRKITDYLTNVDSEKAWSRYPGQKARCVGEPGRSGCSPGVGASGGGEGGSECAGDSCTLCVRRERARSVAAGHAHEKVRVPSLMTSWYQ